MKDWIMEQYIKERVENMGHKVGEATELKSRVYSDEQIEAFRHFVGKTNN